MAPMKSFTQKISLLAASLRTKRENEENSDREIEAKDSENSVQLRRVYTSDHLINLRNQQCCVRKPVNLPDLDIVLDVSHYKFGDSEAYVVSKENDRAFKEYLRVLIERAFDDTEFCGTFCRSIISLEPSNEGNTGFKSFLNKFIEIEFEKVVYITYDVEAKKKQWEEAGDVRLKTSLQQELQVAKHWYRIKLGVAKLFGELYRIGILHVKTVTRAIEKLLLVGGNESLESLYWMCYQIAEKLRQDCADYAKQSGIPTDLFSFYVLKLNEYSVCFDLNEEIRAKIEKLLQAVNGLDQITTNNGSGDRASTSDSSLEVTYEFD